VTGVLLDTSILSEFAPGRSPPRDLREWLTRRRPAIFIPVVALTELEQGIAKLRRAGGAVRADRLAAWLDGLLTTFADHIVGIDATIARRAGAMSDAARATGRHPGLADVLIAASAAERGLAVATRNRRHFAALAVACVDPPADRAEKGPTPR
jgi:hypothetical protein